MFSVLDLFRKIAIPVPEWDIIIANVFHVVFPRFVTMGFCDYYLKFRADLICHNKRNLLHDYDPSQAVSGLNRNVSENLTIVIIHPSRGQKF